MDLLYVQPCLCDTFGSPYDEGNDQIFSVLGIDMLEATPADDPTDEDLKSAALKTLANEITSFKLDHKFKFDSLENTNFRES